MPLGLMEAANADCTILAPNAELAATLFDAIERAHRDSGRELWPTPRVRDFGSWLQEQHVRGQLADSSTPRCLTDVEERELWRAVVLDGASAQQFLEPAGAARAAAHARRTIFEYDIPLRAVADYGSEESRTLLDWIERFAQRCRALDCISADQLLRIADRTRTSVECTAEPVAWIESPAWRPAARRWLHSRAGVPLQPCAAVNCVSPLLLRAGSPDAELAAIGEWARSNLQAMPGFRAWICIPDLNLRRPELVDALDAALSPRRFALDGAEMGAPYAVAGGTPLADYPPARAALSVLSAGEGAVSFEQWSALLRAADVQAGAAEAVAAARLDVALRSRAPSEQTLGEWLALARRVAEAERPGPVGALERLHAAARILAELRGNHPMSRWIALWIRAFEAGPWSLRHRWSSAEYQSAERFRELLAALAAADPLFGAQSRRSAEGILRRAARDTAFQAQTGIPPIWVSGQLMDPWLAYQGLWVAGCGEERWPPPADPIPLLPVPLQRQYGVIGSAVQSQLQFAEDLQGRWQARAVACVFSCADSGDGRRAALSPLLRELSPPATDSPLASAAQPHWLEHYRCAPGLEQLIDEQAPAFGPDELTRGVATLKAQSRCAFRGFAETRLMTSVLDRPLPGFNDRERGELLHDALEQIWSEVRDSRRLMAIDALTEAALLRDSVALAIDTLCRRRDPGARWRERERIRMQALLGKWLAAERLRAPFCVERLEQRAQTAQYAGLPFTVRIDRVDRLEDGARVLIDYNRGSADRDWRGERPDNPQLPIYALLLPEGLVAVAYGKINAADCCFVPEAERSGIFKPGGAKTRLEGMSSLADLMQVWSRRIERLAAQFAEGRAAVDPTSSACQSCRLHGLCRVPSALDMAAVLDDVDAS